MNTFLTVPITIREQIYHELLTYIPSATNIMVSTSPTEEYQKVASSSPICRLLTLNRQVNAEVLQFLSSQLCVLVKANHSCFITSIFDERDQRLPLISQLQSRSGVIKKDCSKFPVAMEWDVCAFRSRLEAESAQCYLMPATSLIPLIQNVTSRALWQKDASLTFRLLETFSYSKNRALEILVHPWLDDPPIRRKFLGINTNDTIPAHLTAELRWHLEEQYSATYYLFKFDLLKWSPSNDNPEDAVRQYKMACKYARLVYDCHFNCIRNDWEDIHRPPTGDRVLTLWTMTCRTAAGLIQALCHLAGTFGPNGLESADASDGVALLQDARNVAEEMISFLSGKPVCARGELLALNAMPTPIRKERSLISFKAHIVCKALGDVDAAIGYLEDAIKYDAESPENPVEKLDELKAGRGTGNKGIVPRVVLWESSRRVTSDWQCNRATRHVKRL